MKPNNPFLIQGYCGPEFFCDRVQESKAMIEALNNGRNLTLIAPRRMGKTGLIHHVFHQLKDLQPDTVVLYLDIYSTQNLGDFVRLLAATVLGKLDTVPQKALSRIASFIKSCRPVFSLDGISGAPKVSIEMDQAEEETTLKEIFEYLASSEKRCCIAIDEFQQISMYPEKGVEALIRSYIQFSQNTRFIFAGSSRHVMQEMFMSAKRPFYQSTQILNIGSIEAGVYYTFAEAQFRKKGLELPENIFNDIYGRFEGHTWYIQVIMNRLYSYGMDADESLVAQAVDDIVGEASYSYENLLATQTKTGVKVLKAIAREGIVKEVNSGAFIARNKLKAASSVNSSLKKLIETDMVYKSQSGYIVYDRFFGEWLRRQQF